MERTENQIWGRRVAYILLGAFGVIIGMNAIMISIATGTFSGTTSVNPYEQGLAYNATLAEKHKEGVLGWNVARAKEGFPHTLTYMVADKSGEPLQGATMMALLTRPVGNAASVTVQLHETKAGVYEAPVQWPGEGRWDVLTDIRKGENRFSTEERVMVR